ncbi:methyltransferase domain-containing protein [Seonamhaeicola sp. ML3]|uniref:methyltransferase domain-containing protein n=1 Tax=Seonamhaeicola sp. ML3 TaxID=2937786 RepID=UPI00200C4654|nr:methyltransferase domain-containing protein [Seonamhaeicola sp. ML3]
MKENVKIYKNRGEFAKAMLKKYISQSPNKIVSDIGAGYGHMQEHVEELKAKWQPFDYVRKIDEATIWNLNIPAPKQSEKAGMVVFLEVLEHLDNPLLGLQNISNHMMQNGILILTTPNPQSSKNTLSLFIRGSLYAFQEKHLKENHVFTPWKHVVYEFLERTGFEIIEYAIVDIQYKKDKRASIKDWLKARAESLIELRNPLARGMSYGLVARKTK